jgi:hypothetical protein
MIFFGILISSSGNCEATRRCLEAHVKKMPFPAKYKRLEELMSCIVLILATDGQMLQLRDKIGVA